MPVFACAAAALGLNYALSVELAIVPVRLKQNEKNMPQPSRVS